MEKIVDKDIGVTGGVIAGLKYDLTVAERKQTAYHKFFNKLESILGILKED